MMAASAAPALANYVSRHVVARLARGMQVTPSLERFEGAVLFLDIAGFSALTDKLASLGPRGAEQLSEVLDIYFGCMTRIVVEHGGDVIDFVGDAMTVVWRAEDSLPNCIRLAVQCALALQAALPSVADRTGVELRQRASISAGELLHATLGGLGGRWHSMVAGEPMRQACAAYQGAVPGEVLVCAPAWDRIRGHCIGEALGEGGAVARGVVDPVALPEISHSIANVSIDATLEGHVPLVLVERFRAGQWRWFAEFRNASTVFVGMRAIDFASADVLDRLQRFTHCVQHELRARGGSFERLSIDDKGVSALTAFGLPLASHEDDAERALHAAEAIRAQLERQRIEVSIGVASGRLFYCDAGGERRRHVTMVGASVNLAARLMTASASGILCDERTKDAARDAFDVSPHPMLQGKGQAEPVNAFSPFRKTAPARPGNFDGLPVGREAERKLLDQRIDALLDTRGGFFLVRGEAGIGKSHLASYAAAQAARRGIRVLTTAASAIECATPYFTWRRILTQLVLGDAPFDEARARAAIVRLLQGMDRLLSWMPLLNDLLPLRIAEHSVSTQITGAARADAMRTLLSVLLEREAAGRPTLLVIDDLHWIDESSASVIGAALRSVPNLLVLANSRALDQSAEPVVRDLVSEAERNAQTIELDALSRQAVAQLAARKLDVVAVPDELAEFVFARTGGNPFYSEELVLALRGAGLLRVALGSCEFSEDLSASTLTAVPDSLQGIIVSRVDRLPASEQLALKVASVIGRAFTAAMLEDIYPITRQAGNIEAMLDTLLKEDTITAESSGGERRFALKHAILQEVVYDLLPFAQRRELHESVAAWIERHDTGNLEAYYAELALHWERAGATDRALDYFEKAARFAFGNYANREAIRLARRAMALAERRKPGLENTRRARQEALLGDAHHELFEYRAAGEHFRRALALMDMPAPTTRPGLAAGLLRAAIAQCFRRAGLRSRGARGPSDRTDLQCASHVHERLAEIAYFDSQPLPLLHATLASLNLAEHSGSTREMVDGFAALSIGCWQARLRGASRFYNARSVALADSRGSLPDIAYAHLVSAVYWAPQGRWSGVDAAHDRATRIYLELGARIRWQQARSVQCCALLSRGRFADAEQALDDIRQSVSKDTPSQVRAWVHSWEMVLALVRGGPLQEIIDRLGAVSKARELHQTDRQLCLGLMAAGHLRSGQVDQALAAATGGIAEFLESPPTAWHITWGIDGLIRTCLDAGSREGIPRQNRQPLRSLADRACTALRRYSSTTLVARPRAALFGGRHALAKGHAAQALRLWTTGMNQAHALGMPYDEALLLAEMGGHPACTERERGQALERACQMFERLGAAYDANATRTRLDPAGRGPAAGEGSSIALQTDAIAADGQVSPRITRTQPGGEAADARIA